MDGDLQGSGLAARVRAARVDRGLSQAAVARRAGISPSYMSRIEGAAWKQGGPWPNPAVVRSLARALSASSTELLALWELERPVRAAGGTARRRRRSMGLDFVVSIGPARVSRAAVMVVEQTPPGGGVRLAESGTWRPATGANRAPSPPAPDHVRALADKVLADPTCLVRRICSDGSAAEAGLASEHTRCYPGPPPQVEVIIGEHLVLLALPDRRRGSSLAASVTVDDPDFVDAARTWFDEELWDAALPVPGEATSAGPP